MILYNVTINIDYEVESEWLLWMKNEHIHDVMKTGCFTHYKIFKLLGEVPESNGATYSIQYFGNHIGNLETYLNDFAPELRRKSHEKFGNRFAAFRSVLEEVI